MKELKTRKLICNITGKTLMAAKEYYLKRAEKAGSEEALHATYVCKDVKILLKKGYTIDQVQQTLHAEQYTCNLTEDNIKEIIGKSSLRINNNVEEQVSMIKTDPEVSKFIQNILNNHE